MSDAETSQNATLSPPDEREKPFSKQIFDNENAAALRIYVKALVIGGFLIILTIFSTLAIYWGALWKTPVRNLGGWVVDFDGGLVGQSVVRGLMNKTNSLKVTFSVVSPSLFPHGPYDLRNALHEHRTWVAVAINPGSSDRLRASYSSPNTTYNGTDAMTMYISEGRNENAYRLLIRPSVEQSLQIIETSFATQALPLFASMPNVDIPTVIATSPQTIVKPIAHKIDNIVPFNIPVASAVTFVGLIYVLILSFFVIMTAYGARASAGFEQSLTTRSLIVTRLVTHIIAEFIISLAYSLLSLAFLIDFTRKFGAGGFFVFWMVNYVGMVSVGLVLEALMPLLTTRYIPFFMIFWVIVNVSVCIQPIEVLPRIYRYGYATPFYNISRAVRCIVFGDKNQLGQNFGILFAWMGGAVVLLAGIQWFVRRRAMDEAYWERIRDEGGRRNGEKRVTMTTTNGFDDHGNEGHGGV